MLLLITALYCLLKLKRKNWESWCHSAVLKHTSWDDVNVNICAYSDIFTTLCSPTTRNQLNTRQQFYSLHCDKLWGYFNNDSIESDSHVCYSLTHNITYTNSTVLAKINGVFKLLKVLSWNIQNNCLKLTFSISIQDYDSCVSCLCTSSIFWTTTFQLMVEFRF